MNYFRRLQLRFKHRKEISTLIDNYLGSTGEMVSRKEMEIINQDFSKKLNYQPIFTPNAEDFKKYLEGDSNTATNGMNSKTV